MAPRGIRNDNPGNLRRNGIKWQGLAAEQTDPKFYQFRSPKWGIRAIAVTLQTYQDHRRAADGSRIDTVDEIVKRWAPAHENPTDAYQQFVSRRLKHATEDQTLDVYDYRTAEALVRAIIQFENGQQPYDDKTIRAGLRAAGLEVPARPMSQSRTVKASTTAGAATGMGLILDKIQAARQYIEPLASNETVQYALAALTLAALGVVVWARIDDMTNEERP